VGGNLPLHEACERALADLKKREAALLFNSGFQANVGLLPLIAEEGDMIFSDSLNHASLIDGCRLSKASVQVYSHQNMEFLETLLKQAASSRRRLIVTEAVFSMDGDVAPLPDILALAEKYDAYVYLDEAHSTGVFGHEGRGLVEHFEDQGQTMPVDRLLQMGTLGKALGSFGAYVAGSQDWIDYFVNKCRSFIFTTALPPPVLGATLKAIELVVNEPERRVRLWEWIRMWKGQSPIIPIVIGGEEETMALSKKLLQKGFYVQGIRPPTVPVGTSRLRLTLSAIHTLSQIEALQKIL
jgi:8-amino-7-oxononanoate synthase